MLGWTSAIATIKTAAEAAKASGKIEAYKELINAQEQILAAQQEQVKLLAQISELQKENADLREKQKLKATVRFHDFFCWRVAENGAEEGPYCSRCWEEKQELYHVAPHPMKPACMACPKCKTMI